MNFTTLWTIYTFQVNIYLLKGINRNTRRRQEKYSILKIKTPERRHWRRSGVFIVNSEHITHLFLVLLLLNLSKLILAGLWLYRSLNNLNILLTRITEKQW